MVTPETVRALAGALPGVREVVAYGGPGFRVRGTTFAHLSADGADLVLAVDPAERAELLARDPATFGPVPGDVGAANLAIRLAGAGESQVRDLLLEAWRLHAPRRLVAEHDAAAEGDAGPDPGPVPGGAA